uniref:Uncharacterized protein n=1 Tax=Salix viminalis TaxID=40686 RepID=A0A6N2LM06_SALVM
MCSNVQHPLAMVGVVISAVLQKLLHSLALYVFAVQNTNVGGCGLKKKRSKRKEDFYKVENCDH